MYGPHRNRKDPAPDPNVLYYRKTSEQGKVDIAVVRTMSEDQNGYWKAMFLRPGQGQEFINHKNSPLKEWEPVYALTKDDLESIIEKVAQRVVEKLSEQGAPHLDIVTAGMHVVAQKDLDTAIDVAMGATEGHACPKCDRVYKYEKSFEKHVSTCSK